jgi:hypothetical protein
MIICSANKYRYWISFDGGTNYNEVKLVKPPVLKYSKEAGQYGHRVRSTEWKFVYHENKTLFGTLITKLATISTDEQKLKVKACLYETFSTLTETPYEGYVPLAGLKINEGDGVVRFSPVEDGVYSWYDQHKAEVHDLINEVTHANTITYDVTSHTIEYWLDGDTGLSYVGFEQYQADPLTIADWGTDTQYYNSNLPYLNYGLGQWVKHGQGWFYPQGDPPIYGWKHYYCKANHFSGPNTEPGIGAHWQDVWHGPVRFVSHMISQESDLPMSHTIDGLLIKSTHGNGSFLPNWPQYPPMDGSSKIPEGGENNHATSKYFIAHDQPITSTETLLANGNILFADVFSHLLTGSGLTFVSQFLTEVTNPVTGLTNKLINLRLIHNAFLKGIDVTDVKGEITLENFINGLCETFNLGWYISGSQLIIEHVKYFENGFQYVGSPTVGIDLTNQTTYPLKWQAIFDRDGGTTDKSYDYFSGSIPEKEIYKFMDGYDYNGQIKYISAYAKKGETKDHTISSFMTDFSFLLFFPADTISEMYSLIACDGTGKILKRNTRLRWIQGNAYSEAPYLKYRSNFNNGDLQWDNVLVDFHTYNRYFTKGNINGRYTATTFNSQAEIKKQAPIIFPRLAAFNPLNLIKTNLGDGRIDTAELDTDTDFIKVTLLY